MDKLPKKPVKVPASKKAMTYKKGPVYKKGSTNHKESEELSTMPG